MDLLNSLFVSAFGISVVFLALILLIVMINVMTFALQRTGLLQLQPAAAGARGIPAAAAASGAPALPASAPAAGTPRQAVAAMSGQAQEALRLTDVDEKTAAMIMAIICDDLGAPPEELYFKSIRLLDA